MTLQDDIAYTDSLDDVVEFDVAKVASSELIRQKKEAIKAWLRELYAQQVAQIEEAVYGWLWFAAVMRRRNELSKHLSKSPYRRIAKLITAVDAIVRRCEEVTLQKVYNVGRYYQLKVRQRSRYVHKYRESDFEILRDSFDIIQLLNKMYRERSQECQKKKKKKEEEVIENV